MLVLSDKNRDKEFNPTFCTENIFRCQSYQRPIKERKCVLWEEGGGRRGKERGVGDSRVDFHGEKLVAFPSSVSH